jgi:hypothetical protein
VEDVVGRCAGLPLAIRIAAKRLRHRPAWNAAELAGRLRDEHRRLPELAIGDRGVAAAFTLSYRYLTPSQQRVFRAVGVHPGQQVDAWSVAASCALPVAATRTVLEDLVDAHLLAQPVTGRYRPHDLLRVFARERAAEHPNRSTTGSASRTCSSHSATPLTVSETSTAPGATGSVRSRP